MSETKTLSGTPEKEGEASPAPEEATPSSSPETPSPRVEESVAEVGEELPPLKPVLSETFRLTLIKTLTNQSHALNAIDGLYSDNRISIGMKSHLKREATKYTATQICQFVEEEIKEKSQ